MIIMTSRQKILKLYKTMLRESQKFPAYNFREYAIRRVHVGFRENKNLTDPSLIENQIKEAKRNLEIIKRQVIIGQLYNAEKLVIENISK
ncbi:LYR motif-containing protein 4 [Anoplophora glabripennis]|uniref:LYR motif-containing protein 4 n=1 Tax=Anoplophora glabripennis TaxID=217634 RepID=UPI0008741376|nr:LYR motif-containing protein 4 [Anoplophora glabripennis]